MIPLFPGGFKGRNRFQLGLIRAARVPGLSYTLESRQKLLERRGKRGGWEEGERGRRAKEKAPPLRRGLHTISLDGNKYILS